MLNKVGIISVFVVIVLVLMFGIYIQKEHAEEATDFCDKTFGENNYNWMEENNYTKCGLAQCWTCVQKEKK